MGLVVGLPLPSKLNLHPDPSLLPVMFLRWTTLYYSPLSDAIKPLFNPPIMLSIFRS